MTAPIDRPDWGEVTAIVPTEDGSVKPAEPANTFGDVEVEQRYRTMVARRLARASLPAHDARDALPAILVDEWEATGGFEARLAQAQKNAITILEHLHPDDRTAFTTSFDALPEGARAAVFSEISLGSSGSVRQASEAEVSRFASTVEGEALVKSWGHRASRNVAIVRDRIARIVRRMPAEDAAEATAWFEDLPSRSADAIYSMIIAG